MSGWFRVEFEGHERTMVALQDLGVEIPRDLALMDLRYYQGLVLLGRRRSMPSRAQLMARWHWTDKRVRNLLADEPAWADPSKAEEWAATKGPAEVQPRSSRGPAEVQVDIGPNDTMDEKGPAEVQPRSSRGPAEVHRRVVGTSTSTSTSTKRERGDGDERRPAGEGKTEKAPKAKRPSRKSNLPPRDLVKPLTDCWSAAWGENRGRYPWEIPGADDHRMARCAVALGYPDGPAPPEALEQLQRAMAIYIAAAEAGEAWPPGPPTTDGFTRKVTEWLLKAGGAARASPADIPRGSIEARIRERLKKASIPEVRAEVRASNRLKPPEIAYALTFLDRLEAR